MRFLRFSARRAATVARVAVMVAMSVSASVVAAQTRVVMLGTGTPNADPERSGPAVAVVVGDRSYLVDAGPGIVRRAAAAASSGIVALEPASLERVFITHLHSDHTLGLPDLLLSPWVLERQSPLWVVGPPGIESMVEHLSDAYAEDIRMRLYGMEPANTTGYQAVVRESRGGRVFEDDRVKVDAIPVPHGSWPVAFAYRFETADKTIVVSGDTTASEALVEAAKGCDILLHEVYSKTAWDRRTADWQRYHAANHTSTVELAEIAKKVRPGLLVLYHQLYWGATDDELVAEVAALYDGKVVSAKDLEVYE